MGLGSSKSREKILVTKPQLLICDLVTLWSSVFFWTLDQAMARVTGAPRA
jgi:hypothetical protein